MFNGPVIIRHREVPISNLPIQADGLRIAHISDLHLRRRIDPTLIQAQAMLLDLDYDVLVCTGDLGMHPEPVERIAALCRRFFGPPAVRSPCLAVPGNHDSQRLAEQPDMPVRFLLDEWVAVPTGGSAIVVAGLNQSFGHRGDIDRALAGVIPGCAVVLLAHYPSTVYRVNDDHVGAVLAGHTHGGQIRLPFLGCVWAQDEIPVRLARGLHGVRGRSLHVSAGLGVTSPLRLRFLCPPEIAVLTLRSAQDGTQTRQDENREVLAEVAA